MITIASVLGIIFGFGLGMKFGIILQRNKDLPIFRNMESKIIELDKTNIGNE